jgi:hypothetical protein
LIEPRRIAIKFESQTLVLEYKEAETVMIFRLALSLHYYPFDILWVGNIGKVKTSKLSYRHRSISGRYRLYPKTVEAIVEDSGAR